MAFTINRLRDGDDKWGRDSVVFKDLIISGTYTAGGYTIAAQDIGLKAIRCIQIAGGDVSQLTYIPFFDFGSTSPLPSLVASVKLRLLTASGVEATGTLSPSLNLRLQAVGI